MVTIARTSLKIIVTCVIGTALATQFAWYYIVFMLCTDFFMLIVISNNNYEWKRKEIFKKGCEAYKINRNVVFNMESRRFFDKKDGYVLHQLMKMRYGHNYKRSRDVYLLCYQLGWYRGIEVKEKQLDGYEKKIESLTSENAELADEVSRLQFTLSHLSHVQDTGHHENVVGTAENMQTGQEEEREITFADIEELRAQGKSIREIASLTGLSKSTVQRRLQK